MASVTQQRVRGRPAHPSGPTFLAYTTSGRKLVTAGSNNVIRVYETGSDGEPVNIDDTSENNLAVAATDGYFVTGAEDGTVCMYSLETHQYKDMITRCTLPIRDVAVSPDGRWVAVSSDEVEVKIIDTEDTLNVLYLRDHPKPVKHITFHPSGSYLAASCTDGLVYLYSFSTTEPKLVRKIDGIIRPLETYSEICSKAAWHPDGRVFAAPVATRDVVVISRSDGERQREFKDGHIGDITALAWSPNGALLATAGKDDKIVLWETKSQKRLARYDYAGVTSIVWHPTENIVAFSNADGEVFIYNDFVPREHDRLLEQALQPAPFIHDPLSETSGNARKPLTNGVKPANYPERTYRRGTPDSLDEILGSEAGDDEDDFVVDDDGAGYALNDKGKRTNGHLDNHDGHDPKRRAYSSWQARLHHSFQPGSTPWRGNRKYLCLNLVGFVWTVDQGSHNTVTVEFYDRELHRDFHFTDPYQYDKACLNGKGTLFSCPSTDEHPAQIYYRPHETWTARADWRTSLPPSEDVTSIALSTSFITVATSANYVRIYTLSGTPFAVHRLKSFPTVACTSFKDYVLTVGNGPVAGAGQSSLLYTITNVRSDETFQSEDIVALPPTPDAELKSIFFSDEGDPCIYDSSGTLLILQHWRAQGQARWVPLLDTGRLERLQSGRKEETYWPVAVAGGKFHCIILKGGDKYPYFPRPLLSEFDFDIPVSECKPPRPEDEDDDMAAQAANEQPRLEESFVRSSLMHSLLEDQVAAQSEGRPTHGQRHELAQKELDIDKTLLQLLNVECREGEERGMKALELVTLMRDRTGKMLEAACKVARRYGRGILEEKIREFAERRVAGMDGVD